MNLQNECYTTFFSEYDPYHIYNVNELLQNNGCFQKDCDFFKKGGVAEFKIDYQKACQFLDDDYSDREVIMPRENKLTNAIFPCGVDATMHKRFHSLKESLDRGFNYDVIHFIVKDEQEKNKIGKLIHDQYQNLLQGIKINMIVAGVDLNIFEAGLTKLSDDSSFGKHYVIISDPTFSSKVELIANSKLEGKTCLGVASAPVKDWKIDMNLYEYEKALGSHEKAAIAWASSAWNFKARQVNSEMKVYTTTHMI